MYVTLRQMVWPLCVFGVLTFAVPARGATDDEQRWERGKTRLERALRPGQSRYTYQKEIAKLGYLITSINQDEPDYLEYEVAKDGLTYEVKIDVDEETRRATDVEVTGNWWETAGTELATQSYNDTEEQEGTSRRRMRDQEQAGEQQDRSRRQAAAVSDQESQRVQQERSRLRRALQPGQTRDEYADQLEELGYAITSINTDEPDRLEYEVVKEDLTYEIHMDIDEDNDEVTNIDVLRNQQPTAATQRVLARTTQGTQSRQDEQMARDSEEEEVTQPDRRMRDEDQLDEPLSRRSRRSAPSSQEEGQRAQRETTTLQRTLRPGQAQDFYAEELEDLGYTIAAISYEVEKNGRTYEVQVDINEDTGKATDVVVTSSPRTETAASTTSRQRQLTREQLSPEEEREEYTDEEYTDIDRDRYSDREQTQQMEQELQALPTGKTKRFYRDALRERGYKVTQVNTNTPEELELEVMKNNRTIALTVNFDEETGESTEITASQLQRRSSTIDRDEDRYDEEATRSTRDDAERVRQADVNATRQEEQPQGTYQQTRRSSSAQQMVQELKALPVGKDQEFYRQALQERGYQIIDTRSDQNQTEFMLEKQGQSLRLTVQFDEETGQSTQVSASGERLA